MKKKGKKALESENDTPHGPLCPLHTYYLYLHDVFSFLYLPNSLSFLEGFPGALFCWATATLRVSRLIKVSQLIYGFSANAFQYLD